MRAMFTGAMVLIASLSGGEAQASPTPIVGGPGGGFFQDLCKGTDVLIGYNVLSGKAMNKFAAVCQAQNNGAFYGANYGLRTWGSDNYNGDYHLFVTPRCPAGYAISELQIWINNVRELDSVAGICSSLVGARPTVYLERSPDPGGSPAAVNGYGSVNCPQGTIAVGVRGRSGALMDALGLECGNVPNR